MASPAHGMMMVRADDAEQIMREEILGGVFIESDPKGKR
jgi:hypothetical protein